MGSGYAGIVYGVGINDSDYAIQCGIPGKKWVCPYYMKWKSMVQRGYSSKFKEKNPSYVDTTVCPEWHRFSVFREWMVTQAWEGNQLDKDFLGNGADEYSPENCAFIPQYLNALFTDGRASRGEHPLGVTWNKKGGYYQMKCCNGDGTRSMVDCFSDPHSAHLTWVKYKVQAAYTVLAKYKKEKCFDIRVERAIMAKIEKLTHAFSLKLEVKRV